MDKNVISIINSTSAISALEDEHLKNVAGYIIWKYKSSQIAQSTGVVQASSKQIGDETGLTPKAVFAVSKQLEEKDFFKYLPWFEGCGRKTGEYHLNLEKFGIVDNAKKAADILANYDSFSEYTIEVFSQLDSDDEKNFVKCYLNWAKPFTTQEQQTAACKLMFVMTSKFRATEKNSFAGDIAEIMGQTKLRLHDCCDRVWMNNTIKEHVDKMYMAMSEMVKNVEYPTSTAQPAITPTILTPANTVKDEDLTPESALKMYEDAMNGILASSASKNQKNDQINLLGRHLVKLNNENWYDDEFNGKIWSMAAKTWMKILTPLGVVNTSTNQTPVTKVDEETFRKIVEEEGGEIVQ